MPESTTGLAAVPVPTGSTAEHPAALFGPGFRDDRVGVVAGEPTAAAATGMGTGMGTETGTATQATAGTQLSSSAQRDLLALHALRQRQLRTAFLYGTRRSWRDRRRIWPAVLVGLTLVGLAVAVMSAVAAFR